MSEWWRSLLVNGEATSHRQRLTEGRAEEEGAWPPSSFVGKGGIALYAIFLCSLDVDNSLVGQRQRWHIAKLFSYITWMLTIWLASLPLFIGPESYHALATFVTNSLTD